MLEHMENDSKTILSKLDQIDTHLAAVEQKMVTGFDDVGESIAGVMAMTTERFDRLESHHVRRIENLELAAVDFRRDITRLKQRAGTP